MTRNEIILGLAALLLIAFSLVVSMVVPRRRPDFPGRRLGVFVMVSALLVLVMLGAIELFGAEEPDSGEAAGAAGAGRAIFEEEKCNTCHTLAAADAEGKVGPNLDEKLKDKDEAFIRESIVNPDAFVEEGFADNLMPETYGEDLSREELTDLVMFLVQSTRGS